MISGDTIRVRFVLSGACYPGYSGRQLQMQVPIVRKDGSPMKTMDLKSQIRREWPSDLSEMQETIKTIEMKILRTGKLLPDDTPLRSVITTTEMQDCSVSAGTPNPHDEEQKWLLMHLVFQRCSNALKQDKGDDKATVGRKKETGSSESRCCIIM
ncbi:hypothetical protein TraAM80_06816 [Trypanosoma rangeli]|uniref:UBL3-like ubiquitin domain-containing protein n=1 Tax=Trypanosoma rangeli TaxID=5698 RepID=A0A3R7RFJ8_TRYRA|nr:uncharacterized protein TraAM80_06816 [Trypanosoma rangeli]RNF01693.1 hypothetical protein TraAM80_06816 [Trypanosoma rangeli]|eukprot:RNF01693.1 hypothetical protein TraAM80_06816 [Trypanosoma rangeli]